MEYLAEAIASSVERQCKVRRPHAVLVAYAAEWVKAMLGWLQILQGCKGDVSREDIVEFLRLYGIVDDPVALARLSCFFPNEPHKSFLPPSTLLGGRLFNKTKTAPHGAKSYKLTCYDY